MPDAWYKQNIKSFKLAIEVTHKNIIMSSCTILPWWMMNGPHRVFNYTCLTSWWRHQMGIFSAILALCAGNSPVTGEFPTQRPVMLSFDVFFDLRLNKRLSKQSWGWWFETPSRSLLRHCNVNRPNEFSWGCKFMTNICVVTNCTDIWVINN